MTINIVIRKPTVEEFESLVESVGFRPHEHGAVDLALRNTVFSVCAEEEEGRIVGVARIIGDGAISFLLTNVMVRPTHQRRRIGSSMVEALCSQVERLPYKNILLEAVPEPGSTTFYERLGFRASRNAPPGMVKWFNDERAAKTIVEK